VVRRKIGLLGHRTHLYEPLTALENLAVVARFLGADAGRNALLRQLEEVGLGDRGDDPVQTFSAGMRQRLALASVLLQRPEVVLLDEPYGHLDAAGFLLVDSLLQRLRAQGATVLMATHLMAPRPQALRPGPRPGGGPAGLRGRGRAAAGAARSGCRWASRRAHERPLRCFRKDLLLQWRGRAQMVAIFAFGAARSSSSASPSGPTPPRWREHAAGFLWLGLLLASTLSLAESFECEMEEQALEGLLLLPASTRALYYGKAIANWHSSRCWEWRWSR